MKRLVKYLFTGFVCSSLLMGCEGQDFEYKDYEAIRNNTNEIYNNTVEIIEEYEDSYNNISVNDISDINYLKVSHKHDSRGFIITTTINIQALDFIRTYEELHEFMNTTFLYDALVIYKDLLEINYYENYDKFSYYFNTVDGENNGGNVMAFTFYENSAVKIYNSEDGELEHEDLSIEEIEVLTNYSQRQSYLQPSVEQEIPNIQVPEIKQEEPIVQQGIGEVFTIGSYSAYYSKTPYGEEVLNVHIDDDCLQVADLDAYYNLVANNAMGCDYIVMTFIDGSNCVIDHSTMGYIANQDLNYYRN